MVIAKIAVAVTAGAVALAPAAGASPDPELTSGNCHTIPTGSLVDQFGYITFCDEEVSPDGSWVRRMTMWGESNRVCTRINTGLGSRRHCIDQPGEMNIYHSDEYLVMPDAIPPGQPGHLG